MAEKTDSQRAKHWRTPIWVWIVVGLLAVAGYLSLESFRGGAEDPSLPPGFAITSGGDSGSQGGRVDPAPGARPLGSLISGSAAGESGRFQASLAVLPLENRTGDTLLDTIGTGMTEELTARLSGVRGLKVIALQSVRELEGLELTPEEVADTLEVDHLLQGAAFPYQDAARLMFRLVRVREDVDVWSNDYSLDRTNQMRAVEEISNEVSAALLEEAPALSMRGASQSTESPGYVIYLSGIRLLNSRTRDGFLRAIDAFRSAIEQDSTLALAYAGLSSVYALSVTYRYDIGLDGFAAAGLALVAADEAVRLDPDLAEAFAARGYISSVALAPAPMVLEDFERALALQPNAPNVPAWYANLLVREGYYDQALEYAARAVSLDPLSPARRTGLAYEALRARDYDLAINEARSARSLSADVVLPRSIQGLALLLSGRAEECLELDLGPHAGLRAICLHALGLIEQAETITDSLRAVLRAGEQAHPEFTNVIAAGDLAAYLAWTGSPERAMHWIHRAYALSPSGVDPRVLNSGVFENVLSNGQMRGEVSGIQERIWARVQREVLEAGFDLALGSR